MTEYEILTLITLTEDQRFNLIQWWAGVTFGLIALSHFAGHKLNLFLVTLVVLLYIGFSMFVGQLFFANVAQSELHRQDLAEMLALGRQLSAVSEDIVSADRMVLQAIGFYLAVVGAFLGSICYVIYAYLRARADGRARN